MHNCTCTWNCCSCALAAPTCTWHRCSCALAAPMHMHLTPLLVRAGCTYAHAPDTVALARLLDPDETLSRPLIQKNIWIFEKRTIVFKLTMLAIKIISEQIRLTNRLTYKSTTPTKKRRKRRTRTESSWLKNEPPPIKGLDIHTNMALFMTQNWRPASS